MVEEFDRRRRQQIIRVRSVVDMVMGTVFSVLGVVFLYFQINDRPMLGRKPDLLTWIIGLMFLTYGVWRVYRGYKKNYFKES